jgi:predicted  nucleic acid-binding Zn-ribbon protein
MSEINRLADFVLKYYGHEIGLGNPQEGESAVDVAIRLLTPRTNNDGYCEEATVDTSEASPAVIDMFTALSRKIVSLESQLRDTQSNVEKLSKEIAEANYVLNSPSPWATQEDLIELNGQVRRLTDDIVMLDERTNDYGTTSKSGAKLLAEAFEALARYEEARR